MIVRVKVAMLVTVTVFSFFLFVIRVIDLGSNHDLSVAEWTVIFLVGIGLLALLAWTIHELAVAETLGEL